MARAGGALRVEGLPRPEQRRVAGDLRRKCRENIHRHPMSLTRLECQVYGLVKSDTCQRPTTQSWRVRLGDTALMPCVTLCPVLCVTFSLPAVPSEVCNITTEY